MALSKTHIDALRKVSGDVLLPGQEGYDAARAIWNAMIDRKPGVIVRCLNTADVRLALEVARDNGIALAVRGGGHNIAGHALCEGGIVIDLSRMRDVRVDPRARRARVEAGATLADVDAATQAHGLAVPLGINSTTGVAGLTLGGGFGWLSRKLGMTVDNLVSAEVVTPSSEVVLADEKNAADLFWALRGGGGNFGVVTRFEYQLHPVGPELFSGLMVFPFAEAKAIFKRYRDFAASASEDLSVWVVARKAPPLPFLPTEVHGKNVVVLAFLYAGDPARGPSQVAPLRQFGTLLGEHAGAQPYTAWQQVFDPLLTPGVRNYWKSHNFVTLPDGLFDAVISAVDDFPSPHCEIFIGALGGATSRVPVSATAYANRDAQFVMNVHTRWERPDEDDACVLWARSFFTASAPFASGGAYVSFLTAEEKDRVRAAYGANYDRLVTVKRKYDPQNLLCINQNIRPD